ncbi:MAG TPA: disulfide bond formation protein B [Casimicrobiaceae bacterium]|nr:disulfide bond formation protein B [Casimicrobiaceae bacterium]
MPQLYLLAAAVNVWVLVLILSAGVAVQLIAGELPCPLCVMQRIALMLCALGPRCTSSFPRATARSPARQPRSATE